MNILESESLEKFGAIIKCHRNYLVTRFLENSIQGQSLMIFTDVGGGYRASAVCNVLWVRGSCSGFLWHQEHLFSCSSRLTVVGAGTNPALKTEMA